MRLIFLSLYIISFLNIKYIHFFAKIIGIIAYYTIRSRRKVGLINLTACFPEKSEQDRIKILKNVFYHAACLVLEYGICWYSSPKKIYSLVEYENKQYLDELMQKNEKIIFLYPHFYSFEICLYKLNQDVPLISIYTKQKNKILDKRILKGRFRYNNLFLINRTDGLLSIIKKIKKSSAPFLYLPDQDFGAKNSIFVPFFNIQTATTDGLSRIAKITNAKVIPLIPIRLNNGKFKLQFYPHWNNFPSKPKEDTIRMNNFIENIVKKYPEQYFWLHKRFKTRPNNDPRPFYD